VTDEQKKALDNAHRVIASEHTFPPDVTTWVEDENGVVVLLDKRGTPVAFMSRATFDAIRAEADK